MRDNRIRKFYQEIVGEDGKVYWVNDHDMTFDPVKFALCLYDIDGEPYFMWHESLSNTNLENFSDRLAENKADISERWEEYFNFNKYYKLVESRTPFNIEQNIYACRIGRNDPEAVKVIKVTADGQQIPVV